VYDQLTNLGPIRRLDGLTYYAFVTLLLIYCAYDWNVKNALQMMLQYAFPIITWLAILLQVIRMAKIYLQIFSSWLFFLFPGGMKDVWRIYRVFVDC